MTNPFNPIDWLGTTQEWFAKTEKSSGFRPYLIYLILAFVVGLLLLFVFRKSEFIQVVSAILILLPVVAFVPMFAWKAMKDPDFCRSEKHVQKIKKMELEMMGSDSKQISADVLERKSITASTKEPLLIDMDDQEERGNE